MGVSSIEMLRSPPWEEALQRGMCTCRGENSEWVVWFGVAELAPYIISLFPLVWGVTEWSCYLWVLIRSQIRAYWCVFVVGL